jgi:hypothetical protein
MGIGFSLAYIFLPSFPFFFFERLVGLEHDLVKGANERLKEDFAVQITTHKPLRKTLLMDCSAGEQTKPPTL